MTIQADDFTSNSLSGTTTVQNSLVEVELGLVPLYLEGNKEFNVSIRRGDQFGTKLATSSNIIIVDNSETVSFTPNVSTINEGESVTFSLQTANVFGTVANLYYTTIGNVTGSDFVTGNAGYFSIINNSANIILQTSEDFSTVSETGEFFTLGISREPGGTIIQTSDSGVVILDTSRLSLTNSSNTITYESNILFNVTVIGKEDGTVFYYDTESLSGNISSAMFNGGNTGSFALVQSNANVRLTANYNLLNGTFRLRIKKDSSNGPIIALSNTIVTDAPLIAGGTKTVEGGETVHIFTTTSNLFVSSAVTSKSINLLMVAGGGGTVSGGGGGAGGFVERTSTIYGGNTYVVQVGAGGNGSNGTNSEIKLNGTTFNGLFAIGGGRGSFSEGAGVSGGSGGGASNPPFSTSAVGGGYNYPGPTQQGFPGNARGPGGNGGHGGGGGAGDSGSPGYGGTGKVSPYSPPLYGTPGPTPGRWFAGGGGATAFPPSLNPALALPGGAGGGGRGGGGPTGTISSGTVNTGGGAGGGPAGGVTGGSGIVIVRYTT